MMQKIDILQPLNATYGLFVAENHTTQNQDCITQHMQSLAYYFYMNSKKVPNRALDKHI